MSAFADEFVTIHHGDAWELAPTLAPQSVHTIVTSPPYWGLRDYGEPGQFGLEPTPEAYVARLAELFALLRPALRDDGTVWLNLGDSYSRDVKKGGSGPNGKHDFIPDYGNARRHMSESQGSSDGAVGRADRAPIRNSCGLAQKQLVGIPWRVAFALQSDGWYLRQDIIWHKPNPMPESVTDRCTKAHEYVFLLSKSPRYFCDMEAIKEPHASTRWGGRMHDDADGKYTEGSDSMMASASRVRTDRVEFDHYPDGGRNKRDVWTVPTTPFAAAHFATFPPALITPCILAGCPERCCLKCGAPWERVTERVNQSASVAGPKSTEKREQGLATAFSGYADGSTSPTVRTLGFKPTCACGESDSAPGTVLDPFLGSGTTAQVARSLGRKCIGFELNADYIEIAATERLAQGVLL